MDKNVLIPNSWLQNVALLGARWIVATVFLFAGYAKWAFWFNPPIALDPTMLALTKFLSIVEPLGALALVIGFLTRWASLGLGIIMVGAIVILSFTMGVDFFTMPQAIGWDYNLLILGLCLLLGAFGAGAWSVDAKRRQNER